MQTHSSLLSKVAMGVVSAAMVLSAMICGSAHAQSLTPSDELGVDSNQHALRVEQDPAQSSNVLPVQQINTEEAPARAVTEGKWGGCTWTYDSSTRTMHLAHAGACDATVPGKNLLGKDSTAAIRRNVQTIIIDNTITVLYAQSLQSLFKQAHSLQHVQGLGNIDTTQMHTDVVSLQGMCSETQLDGSEFEDFYIDDQLVDVRDLYRGTLATQIDLSHITFWHNITDSSYMLAESDDLHDVVVPWEDAYNLQHATFMFADDTDLYNVKWLLRTPNLTDANSMFRHCTNLRQLDLTKMLPQRLETAQYMFYEDYGLTNLKLGRLALGNISNAENVQYIFGDTGVDSITMPHEAMHRLLAFHGIQPGVLPSSMRTLWRGKLSDCANEKTQNWEQWANEDGSASWEPVTLVRVV
ncbi:hypothetical protein D2E26_0998 [Bifidobacterium dolichotidis]|uniref:Lipoprotein n=1 Tax=Bifidobacterium dolichotidis TaxID=2306976 RepID=A0A430FQ70_9BIFI|nr:BspA family leucine-rich repeat surface protein [Bifidobacterium dolichotidis]RSX54944.1 hypothetical protein D2E26_0998 [Bifidobacterium dolichotidis]